MCGASALAKIMSVFVSSTSSSYTTSISTTVSLLILLCSIISGLIQTADASSTTVISWISLRSKGTCTGSLDRSLVITSNFTDVLKLCVPTARDGGGGNPRRPSALFVAPRLAADSDGNIVFSYVDALGGGWMGFWNATDHSHFVQQSPRIAKIGMTWFSEVLVLTTDHLLIEVSYDNGQFEYDPVDEGPASNCGDGWNAACVGICAANNAPDFLVWGQLPLPAPSLNLITATCSLNRPATWFSNQLVLSNACSGCEATTFNATVAGFSTLTKIIEIFTVDLYWQTYTLSHSVSWPPGQSLMAIEAICPGAKAIFALGNRSTAGGLLYVAGSKQWIAVSDFIYDIDCGM